MRQRLVQILLIVFIIAVNIACDQGTKIAARKTLQGKGTVRVIRDTFVLRYVENEGAFLSFGARWPRWARYVFLIVGPGLLVCGLAVYILIARSLRRIHLAAYCCIIGGGLSNLIDRLLYGGRVSDFMNLGIGNLRTGIFNFADLSVLLGVVLLLFTLGKPRKKAEEPGDTR